MSIYISSDSLQRQNDKTWRITDIKLVSRIAEYGSIVLQPLLLQKIAIAAIRETFIIALSGACGVVAGIGTRISAQAITKEMGAVAELVHMAAAMVGAIASGMPSFLIAGPKAACAAAVAAGATEASASGTKIIAILAIVGGTLGAAAEIYKIHQELCSKTKGQPKPGAHYQRLPLQRIRCLPKNNSHST